MNRKGSAVRDIAGVVEAFWPNAEVMNFIGGKWDEPALRSESFNPSTGEVLASVPESSAADVDRAVLAAEDAQTEWRKLTPSERARYLGHVLAALAERGDEIALLESLDSGNPMPATRRDLGLAQRYLAEWPSQACGMNGRYTQPHSDGHSIVSYEPYGVVGKIIAYNHPMLFALAGAIFPLMAGNTMVIKTAAQTPLATLALGAVFKETLPPGVINIVGGGAEAGDALVVHPRVKRIAFTGSDRTALTIQSRLSASGTVKHFTAELGGKNAFIIFEDSDVEQAAAAAFSGLSLVVSAGQSCQSTAKVLVHESLYQEVIAMLAERIGRLRVGKSYEETTEMGPLVSQAHAETVSQFIRSGVAEGARLVVGGDGVAGPGYFVQPTLFADVTPDMQVANEEIFGPVVVVMPFRDEDEAVRLANDTPYGLSAAVWTKSIDRAIRVTSELRAGYIWVNDANRHYPGAPFGGMGASGVGREESIEELLSYVEPKSVNIRVGER